MEVHWNWPSYIELRLYGNIKGFGAALIQKLKETSIRDNLYFEYKDRIIEEANDDLGRVVRKKQKTKVYGIDSSKGMRDLLIELLRERMELHKDKIKSKMMLDELSKMVVKRNGKVEHSENSHDDLVFSYLMALYVWYEGKNIRENWHINKNTIRTEENVDDVLGIPESEKDYVDVVDEIELDEAKSELKKEVDKHLADMKKAMGITFHEFYQQERQKEEEILKNMLTNPEVRKAYSEYSQIPIETLNQMNIPGTVSIPPSVFTDFNSDPEAIARAEYEKNFGLRKINPGR